VGLVKGDWRANLVDHDAGLTAILREAKTVAVLGAKANPAEPAHYVPAYLSAHGYRVLPVNPRFVGQRLHDAATVARLDAVVEGADVIEIFRRPEYLPDHAAEILALPWRPKAVWFQLGIRNDAAAEKLARAGIKVVQDRCMMPEHRRLISTGT
jgi:predicted CoA-binding protein